MGFRKLVLLLLLFPHLCFSQGITESKQKMREFMISVTYGTLAGALLGGASLAFTSSPGDHMSRIAKGASLGLYAGIALGIYVTKEPGENVEEEEDPQGAPLDSYNTQPLNSGGSLLQVIPSVYKKSVDGAIVSWTHFF